jgi:hypothetical protein
MLGRCMSWYLNEIRNELDDLDNALKADAPEG